MSYAVAHVIYGTYFSPNEAVEKNTEVAKAINLSVSGDPIGGEDVGEILGFLADLGFESIYSSGGSNPCFFGEVFFIFDECSNAKVDKDYLAMFEASDEVKKKVKEEYKMLPKAIRSALPPLGTYIVWGSS